MRKRCVESFFFDISTLTSNCVEQNDDVNIQRGSKPPLRCTFLSDKMGQTFGYMARKNHVYTYLEKLTCTYKMYSYITVYHHTYRKCDKHVVLAFCIILKSATRVQKVKLLQATCQGVQFQCPISLKSRDNWVYP